MNINTSTYDPSTSFPSEPIHPGEMLGDELEARGLTQKKFAETLSVPYSQVNEIVNGKRPITAEFAYKIEAALGTPAYIWAGLQNTYNLQMAKQSTRLNTMLDKIRQAAALL